LRYSTSHHRALIRSEGSLPSILEYLFLPLNVPHVQSPEGRSRLVSHIVGTSLPSNVQRLTFFFHASTESPPSLFMGIGHRSLMPGNSPCCWLRILCAERLTLHYSALFLAYTDDSRFTCAHDASTAGNTGTIPAAAYPSGSHKRNACVPVQQSIAESITSTPKNGASKTGSQSQPANAGLGSTSNGVTATPLKVYISKCYLVLHTLIHSWTLREAKVK